MGLLDGILGSLIPGIGPVAKVLKIISKLKSMAKDFEPYFSKIDFTDREGKGRLVPTLDGRPCTYVVLPSVQADLSGVPLVFSVTLEQGGVSYALVMGHTPKGMNKGRRFCQVNGENHPYPVGNCAFSLEPSRKAVSRFALRGEWEENGNKHVALMPGFLWTDTIS